MRPRISRAEATYLVTVLKAQVEEMSEKLGNVEQLERDLALLIHNLKYPIQPQYNNQGYRIENRLIGPEQQLSLVRLAKALKQEHPNLIGEKFRLWKALSIHKRLLAKYQAIAEGQPHNGTYKKLRTSKLLYPEAPLIPL